MRAPLFVVLMVAVASCGSTLASPSFEHCDACLEVVALAQRETFAPTLMHVAETVTTVHSACARVVGQDGKACAWLDKAPLLQQKMMINAGNSPMAVCRSAGACPRETEGLNLLEVTKKAAAAPIDVRVTSALGSNGYGPGTAQVRLSVISETASGVPPANPLFPYSAPFKYRWTDKYLRSGIVSVTPGTPKKFEVDGVSFNISVPAETEGSHGIIIADPCYDSKWIPCNFGGILKIFERLPALLNAAMSKKTLDYWMILGDNFYDRTGEITTPFFNKLSLETKTTLFAATPGNHDYWVMGAPEVGVQKDQYANGFMQFYPQDTLAARSSGGSLFNFSVDPDKESTVPTRLPHVSNSVWYNRVGNAAFVGFSGAYAFDEVRPMLEDACKWVGTSNPAAVFFVGHWNEPGAGCSDTMDLPAIYKEVQSMPGCDKLGHRLKYVMGHTHCNEVTQTVDNLATGFMVAGQGMIGCGNFGIPYFSTKNNRLLVSYFPIADVFHPAVNNFDKVQQCFATSGIENCQHLATIWLNQSLTE